jgi:hypothetical protein
VGRLSAGVKLLHAAQDAHARDSDNLNSDVRNPRNTGWSGASYLKTLFQLQRSRRTVATSDQAHASVN